MHTLQINHTTYKHQGREAPAQAILSRLCYVCCRSFRGRTKVHPRGAGHGRDRHDGLLGLGGRGEDAGHGGDKVGSGEEGGGRIIRILKTNHVFDIPI